MLSTIHLFIEIIRHPKKEHYISKKLKICAFDKSETQYRLSKIFIRQDIIMINHLKELSWLEILFRKIRVTAPPRKDSLGTISDRIKRFLIKYLFLSISAEIKILNIHNLLYLEKSENSLITYSAHCYEIYQTHLKNFKIIETFKKYHHYVFNFFYILSKILRTKHLDNEHGITVFTNPISPYLIYSYHNLHPNKRLIVRYHDMLTQKDIRTIKSLRRKNLEIQIETYSRTDALENNLIYRPNGVDPTFMKSLDKDFRVAIYRFYGATGDTKSPIKNRVSTLPLINEKLTQIYPLSHIWIDYKIVDSIQNFIPYKDFARQSALCEIYLDLARTSLYEGFSFRITEALHLNRKIITNRPNIVIEPFYDPSRVFIIGKDSTERLKSFLENDLSPIPDDILKTYDSSLWWTDKDPLLSTQPRLIV